MNPVQNDLFPILYEDAELLVINKPAGLVCHPTKTDAYSSLISRVRLYFGQKSHDAEPLSSVPSVPSHPQLINRLDRETSGVTIVAKSALAARELRRLWENRQVEKEYLAIVHGHVEEAHGLIEAPLGKDERSRVAIKDCVRPDGASARTEFWTVSHIPTLQPFTLLRLHPHTGRKHQIRIHLAHIGYPIVGDKLYGGDEDLYLALVEDRLTPEQRQRLILPHHALHARAVRFTWRGREIAFTASPEPWFAQFARMT